jgi:hypothetical protein
MGMEQMGTISGCIYDVYDEDSQDYRTGRMPRVGQKVEFEDGRKYVFCSTAVDVTAGQAVGAAAVLEETAVSVAAGVGDVEVRIVEASVAANFYKEGSLTVVLGTGVGYTYKIKGNTASATVDAVANTVILTLYNPLQAALATTDDVTLKRLRAENVIVNTASTDPVGIAAAPAPAATASKTKYFWVQTRGVAFALGIAGAGGAALMSTAAGALIAQTAGNAIVATGVEAGASNSVVVACFPE